MAARRQAIMDAAEALIRKRGATSFTMAELAMAAGVSAATPFNLFESKLCLLYALLIRSLDGVNDAGRKASAEPDPFIRVMNAAEGVGRMFTADARFYRPLHQVLLSAVDPVHRPHYLERAALFWYVAIDGLQSLHLFSDAQSRGQLACELVGMALGRVDLWVHGEIENENLPSHLAYGALALAVGLTSGARRKRVLSLMQACRPAPLKAFRLGSSAHRARVAPRPLRPTTRKAKVPTQRSRPAA